MIWMKKVLLILLAALLAGCAALQPQATPSPTPATIENAQPVVSATGKVTPQQFSQLSVTTPGLIQEVLVEEGQTVKAGDVLVRLKGVEDLNAAIQAAQFEVDSAQKALTDLDKAAKDAATAALQLIAQREHELRDDRYQLDNFTPPVDMAKMNAEAALTWAKQQLDAAYAKFEPYRYYPENDKTRKDMKKEYDDAQADYNAAIKRLEYETAVKTDEANLEDARSDYATYSAGPDPKDVALAQSRLSNAKAALAAAQAKLNDLELHAPFDGTISEINVHLGQWLQPGQAVVMLADLGHLQVETTDLNEIDAARVSAGSPVTVTFDALPGVNVTGKVKSISPKSSEGSGVNYKAVILLDQVPDLLRWGMTAFVDIAVSG